MTRLALTIGCAALALSACAPPPSPTANLTRPRRVAPTIAPERPTGPVIVAEAWSFEGIPGQRITTRSYDVHTTLHATLLLERLPSFVELAMSRYTRAIVDLPRPAERLDTYVMRTRGEWTRVTRKLLGTNAEVYLRIPRGGFAASERAVYYDIGSDDTFALAAHEGWHQYTQGTFQDQLPVWLDEGVATWMEGFAWDETDRNRPVFTPWGNRERFDLLRRAARSGGVITLSELLTQRPQDAIAHSNSRGLIYYAQVWAMLHYLYEGDAGAYRPALQRMLLDAANGRLYDRVRDAMGERAARAARVSRTGSAVLRTYLTEEEFETFEDGYLDFIDRVTRPGAERSIDRGVSPAT